MNRFKYGGLDKQGIYLDETVMRMCYTHRRLFGQLAMHLIAENKNDKALKALAYAEKVIPSYNVPYNYLSGGLDFAKAYATIGKKAEARKILDDVFNNALQYMNYYTSLDNYTMAGYQQDCMMQVYIMQHCVEVADTIDTKYGDQMFKKLEAVARVYQAKGGQLMQQPE